MNCKYLVVRLEPSADLCAILTFLTAQRLTEIAFLNDVAYGSELERIRAREAGKQESQEPRVVEQKEPVKEKEPAALPPRSPSHTPEQQQPSTSGVVQNGKSNGHATPVATTSGHASPPPPAPPTPLFNLNIDMKPLAADDDCVLLDGDEQMDELSGLDQTTLDISHAILNDSMNQLFAASPSVFEPTLRDTVTGAVRKRRNANPSDRSVQVTCTQCNTIISQPLGNRHCLKRHAAKHLPADIPSQFQCSVCSYGAISASIVERHVREIKRCLTQNAQVVQQELTPEMRVIIEANLVRCFPSEGPLSTPKTPRVAHSTSSPFS